uniref:Uncharacterized protein n=1 Tax=Ixodes scapularis TaxID=6945 RepID=A0A4D5RY31_IXOSC
MHKGIIFNAIVIAFMFLLTAKYFVVFFRYTYFYEGYVTSNFVQVNYFSIHWPLGGLIKVLMSSCYTCSLMKLLVLVVVCSEGHQKGTIRMGGRPFLTFETFLVNIFGEGDDVPLLLAHLPKTSNCTVCSTLLADVVACTCIRK